MADAVIDTKGLSKQYGKGATAVDDLDLAVEEGEVYGFLGPNGAGKSTTIDMLLGTIKPTSGSATVLGHDIRTGSLPIRRSTGFLPGEFGLYDRHTAKEHVDFALDCKAAEGDPAALLERVGLSDAIEKTTKGFSTGMKRRLALAMALTGAPDLLVLDEPTRGLDPNGSREVRSIVRAESERGATVFFSSHSLEQVEAVCDRVGVLKDGTLIAEDSVESLLSEVGQQELVVAVDSVSERLLTELRRLPAVNEVEVDGTEITLLVSDTESKATVIKTVESAGQTVRNITSQNPSLEEFFATVTVDQPTPRTSEGQE